MQDAARIIRGIMEGLSPSQIAVDLNLPFNSVVQEINAAVHDGRLLRSQVQSTLKPEWLDALRTFAPTQRKFSPEHIRGFIKQIYRLELSVEELKFCFIYCGKSFWAGETYELLCDIERTLHDQIKRILMEEIRASEDEVDVHHWDEAKETVWWRKGVPEDVRVACVERREKDAQLVPEHPYCYTDLISLKKIIFSKAKGKGWRLFEDRLPKAVVAHKDDFGGYLDRLNSIRNRVMHPVRGTPPNEEDFRFVKQMHETLHLSKWRKQKAKGPKA
jgi:hypothetical protein